MIRTCSATGTAIAGRTRSGTSPAARDRSVWATPAASAAVSAPGAAASVTTISRGSLPSSCTRALGHPRACLRGVAEVPQRHDPAEQPDLGQRRAGRGLRREPRGLGVVHRLDELGTVERLDERSLRRPSPRCRRPGGRWRQPARPAAGHRARHRRSGRCRCRRSRRRTCTRGRPCPAVSSVSVWVHGTSPTVIASELSGSAEASPPVAVPLATIATGVGRVKLWLACSGWPVPSVTAVGVPLRGGHYVEVDLHRRPVIDVAERRLEAEDSGGIGGVGSCQRHRLGRRRGVGGGRQPDDGFRARADGPEAPRRS